MSLAGLPLNPARPRLEGVISIVPCRAEAHVGQEGSGAMHYCIEVSVTDKGLVHLGPGRQSQ